MDVASSWPDHLPTLSIAKTSELSLLVKSSAYLSAYFNAVVYNAVCNAFLLNVVCCFF